MDGLNFWLSGDDPNLHDPLSKTLGSNILSNDESTNLDDFFEFFGGDLKDIGPVHSADWREVGVSEFEAAPPQILAIGSHVGSEGPKPFGYLTRDGYSNGGNKSNFRGTDMLSSMPIAESTYKLNDFTNNMGPGPSPTHTIQQTMNFQHLSSNHNPTIAEVEAAHGLTGMSFTQPLHDNLHSPRTLPHSTSTTTILGFQIPQTQTHAPEISHLLASSAPMAQADNSLREQSTVPTQLIGNSQNGQRSSGTDVQFGSDPSFGQNFHFIAPSRTSNTTIVTQKTLAVLDCLQPNSAATTRPSSPATTHLPFHSYKSKATTINPPVLVTSQVSPRITEYSTIERGEPPRKRIKSPESGTTSDEDETPGPSGSVDTKISEPTPKKRARKPKLEIVQKAGSGGTVKSKRAPLTAEQKRQNHNESEKRRREYIAQGYGRIKKVWPGMEDKQKSKASLVEENAARLRSILTINRILADIAGRSLED